MEAARVEGASGSEGIGRGVRNKRIGAQIAEVFGGGGERQGKDEQNMNNQPQGKPPKSGAAGEKNSCLRTLC